MISQVAIPTAQDTQLYYSTWIYNNSEQYSVWNQFFTWQTAQWWYGGALNRNLSCHRLVYYTVIDITCIIGMASICNLARVPGHLHPPNVHNVRRLQLLLGVLFQHYIILLNSTVYTISQVWGQQWLCEWIYYYIISPWREIGHKSQTWWQHHL